VRQEVQKYEVIQKLRQEILSLQGFHKHSGNEPVCTGLGTIEQAFPQQVFPIGTIHEFISNQPTDAAATSGFMTGLAASISNKSKGYIFWIGTCRTIYPTTLKQFGIDPERVIFVDLFKIKDALWVIEEALKCEALSLVVGELRELSFKESRRLQLAVENSHVTGFIHRYKPAQENITASIARWKIQRLPSLTEDGLPGVGFPRWQVSLTKVRNGKPGSWQLEWANGSFHHIDPLPIRLPIVQPLKTA
jgi:protein ImuA